MVGKFFFEIAIEVKSANEALVVRAPTPPTQPYVYILNNYSRVMGGGGLQSICSLCLGLDIKPS